MWRVILNYLELILVDHLMQKCAVNSGPIGKHTLTDTDGNPVCIEWCVIPVSSVIDFTIVLVCSVYKEGGFSQLTPEILRIEFVPHTTKMINPFHILEHQAAHCELG